MKSVNITAYLFLMLSACRTGTPAFDATGVFEAEEIMVSAEMPGRITQFHIQEGDVLPQDTVVALIDAGNTVLQKAQVEASIQALQEKTADAGPQLAMLQKQLQVQTTQMQSLLKERERFTRLVAADAATPRQLDDIHTQISILEKQMDVTRSQMQVQQTAVATQNKGILSEQKPLAKKAEILHDQINRSRVTNPINGTVLTKYAYTGEITGAGKALYKIADLQTVYLRAYISTEQLTQVKLGDEVTVLADSSAQAYRKYRGKITWISEQAEFTPKTIQTKNERANQVYALKIRVSNDGYLKLGQYGEVKF